MPVKHKITLNWRMANRIWVEEEDEDEEGERI